MTLFEYFPNRFFLTELGHNPGHPFPRILDIGVFEAVQAL